MGVLPTFLIYLLAAVFMCLTFMGAGKLLYGKLDKTCELTMTLERMILEFIIGFCVLYILSTLLFTYLPTYWAMQSNILLLFIPLSLGLWTQACRILATNSRKNTLIFWSLFIFSFMLVYLPFSNAHKIFLASEGGGDITGYLGYAKVFINDPSYRTVEVPRFLIIMRNWMEGMGLVTVPRPQIYAELEPAVSAFNNNLSATNYLPTLFFFPLRFIFPIEVLYMTIWMVIAAMTPCVVALSIPKKIKRASLWKVLAFLLLAFSSGFHSVFLNHYIYQFISIFMIAAFFSSAACLIVGDSIPQPKIAICLLSMTIICMSYFPATPPILVFTAWGGLLFFIANRWRNPNRSIMSYISTKFLGWVAFVFILLFPILLSPFFLVTGMSLVNLPKDPKELEMVNAVWGPSVQVLNEIWNGMQGTLIHNLASPYTSLDFHLLWNYRVAIASIFLFIICLLPVFFVLIKSKKFVQSWKGSFPLIIFVMGSLFIVIAFLRLCNTHTYIFDKMAMLTLPITISSILILLAIVQNELSGRWTIFFKILSSVFLLSWIVGDAQARLYQIESFRNGANRSMILYTQNYLKTLPVTREDIAINYPFPPEKQDLSITLTRDANLSVPQNIILIALKDEHPVVIRKLYFAPLKITTPFQYISYIVPAKIGYSPVMGNTSRTIMYSNTETSTAYFLMEASLAGFNTFPGNNYSHGNYPEFLSKIDFTQSNYVISHNREAKAVDISYFYLGEGNDFAVPIDPMVNPAKSSLPQKLSIDRPYGEGTGIVFQAMHNWNVRCKPFEKLTSCQIEEALMGAKKYHLVSGFQDKDGTCLFKIKKSKHLRVLRLKQCHEILFENA